MRLFRKTVCYVLGAFIAVGMCSCSTKPRYKVSSLKTVSNTLSVTNSFTKKDDSEVVDAAASELVSFIAGMKEQTIDYGYNELFDYNKAIEIIDTNHTVAEHQYSVLDENGALTKERLFQIVQSNNKNYFDENSNEIYQEISNTAYLKRVCEIITTTVNDMLKKYPQIDKERVYCNLANLKIVDKNYIMELAAIEPNMVLHLSAYTSMAADMLGESMYSALVHETMHILQKGCSCERIEGCVRRSGFSYYMDGWEQNFANAVWLSEASAERLVCLYSNVKPSLYFEMIKDVALMNLCTMLKDDVPANYVETLSFYDNINPLFKLFDCENAEDKKEIVSLLYALEMYHMAPEDVKKSYLKYYGIELADDELNKFRYIIRYSIIKSLTKQFYINLATAAAEEELTKNDVFFMINLFEDMLDFRLDLNRIDKDAYNIDFLEWYRNIRNEFFNRLDNVSLEDYFLYNAGAGENTINASVDWLDDEKVAFLIENYEKVYFDFKIE